MCVWWGVGNWGGESSDPQSIYMKKICQERTYWILIPRLAENKGRESYGFQFRSLDGGRQSPEGSAENAKHFSGCGQLS